MTEQMTEQKTVGIIGAGVMGLGIATRLLTQGYAVKVRDIDPAREALAGALGAQPLTTPRQIAEQCDVVLVAVLNAAQIDSVLHQGVSGAEGLLIGLEAAVLARRDGCPLILLCSTIAPEDVIRLGGEIQVAGGWVLDAPISGGPVRAAAGTMSMMLAGNPIALNQGKAVLDTISASQFLISDQLGDAMRAKLVNNLMAGANLVAAAEAMTLASAMGLDLVVMSQLVAKSSGQSWMCDDRIVRALVDDYEPRAQTHVLTKDVHLANQAAMQLGLDLPVGTITAQTMQAACDAGHRTEDDASLFKYLAGYK